MKRNQVIFGLLTLATLSGVWETQAQTPPIRILPVGDSITFGSSVAGGYRLPLYQLLTNVGFNVDFVGTQTGNGAAGLPDPDHEGHGGWQINQIDSIILGVLSQVDDPDAILLMIGTNDYGTGNGNGATNRLDALITKLALARPHTKIIVASLTQRGEPYETQIQTTFNPFVPVIVAQHAALGQQVYFTDMHAAVPVADMPDALHPGATGYAKMATNWFTALTNHFTPNGSTNAPAILRAAASANLSNVVINFSKPVADPAASVANFALDGGAAVLGATLDPATKRNVTLTTSPLLTNVQYTLTVSGVTDRTTAQTLIAPNSTTTFFTYGSAGRGVFNNVPEATNYSLVYALDIPNATGFAGGVNYDVNLKNYAPANFTRIAYYLELQTSNSPVNFIWVSLDSFTTNLDQLGVPTIASGAFFQQAAANLNVLSSVSNITTGSALSGWLEFWPSNYVQTNAAGVANASSANYDWGDQMATTGTYGSMQIHNPAAGQVLFAFNNWNTTSAFDLGIGNRPGSLDADWTFAANGPTYVVKTLQVFILPTDNTTPPALVSAASQSNNTVVLTFSKPIDEDATNVACYALSGGGTVQSAAVEPLNKLKVTLVTTPLAPAAFYTVTVNGVHDRTSNQTPVAANSTATFMSPAARGAYANVPEAANYALVYSLNLPNAMNYGVGPVPYDVDRHTAVSNLSRVAYYLELQAANGPIQFIWTSMDPFTQDTARLGVPAKSTGALFQQPLTNLTVWSSVAGIVLGTNLSGGNLEFWSWDYQEPNDAGVPNASGTLFDWGDRCTTNTGGYGSMQIHNPGASQVLWAFNNWGGTGGGNACLGIGNNTSTTASDWTHVKNAASYTIKTLQVFALPADNTNPPSLLGATASQAGYSNVVLTFSKPLEDASATALGNYGLSGGVAVLGAVLDPVTKLTVTLTTSPQAPGTWYAVTVNNLRDRTTNATVIAAGATASFLTPAAAAAAGWGNVPEALDYSLVYSLEIPNAGMFNTTNVPYSVDLRRYVTNFSRVAYYLELASSGGPTNFLWAAMDAFTNDAGKIGVPVGASGAFFQQPVSNLTVYSSVAGVVSGTNMSGGNLEFWPGNYAVGNASNVPNASSSLLDWGDAASAGNGHGSMQIHNAGARQVLMGFNNWGGPGTSGDIALGIGNRPGATDPDWTFAANASTYSVKRLQVFALADSSTNLPVIASVAVQPGSTSVVVTFSKMLDDSAANSANFSFGGGLTIFSAALDPITKAAITLTTSPIGPSRTYTLTVNNVQDRTASHLQIVPNTTATFMAPALRGVFNNLDEVVNYLPVYTLSIPAAPNYTRGIGYDLDNRASISTFSRIAYYLELQQSGGPVNYVWVSMDAFTNNVGLIGVPVAASGAVFQQKVTNLNVYSSVAGIITGTGIATGNIEFWPGSYTGANAISIPNASGTAFDFGDTFSAGTGYGSMQVHNHGASQVLLAFNHWNAGVNACLGIGNRPATADVDWTFADNANAYTVRTLQVFVLPVNQVPPVLTRVAASAGYTNVVLSFSKPLDDGAVEVSHYSLSGGVAVLSAVLDPTNKMTVTLTTSAQQPGTWYTVTLNGLADRTTSHLPLADNSTGQFLTAARPGGGVYANVPEAAGWTMVYALNIPNTATFTTAVPYAVDNHFGVTNFTRVAYYVELAASGGPTNFLWAAMDPFTADAGKIGVPTTASGALFQQSVTNLTVYSSVPGVVAGTNLTGNIEFWPWAYNEANAANVAQAAGHAYDWGDNVTTGTGNYGSMQIHNYAARQVLFAFNRWGGTGGTLDLGLGNNPGSANPDWTFMQNAGSYTVKSLQVFVLPAADASAPTLVKAAATPDLSHLVVTFSEPVADLSAALSNYSINNGVMVISAVLSNNLREVLLTTSPLAPRNYTLTVNGVRDRSAQANPLAPNSAVAVTLPDTTARIAANVAESANYQMVYSLAVPNTASFQTGVPYAVDNHFGVTNFSRVAYYLELDANWIWVAVDAFSPDAGKIGVPNTTSGAAFQQKVTNMTVYSSVAGIVTGTGIATGNLEFWPGNYSQANAIGIPNASATAFDFGDTYSAGTGYGSMQLHNHGASQVLFALNNWNNGSVPCIGIGNRPATADVDWTFAANAASYTVKTLQVFVLPAPAPVQLVSAVATQDLEHVTVTFSQPVADSAANLGNFSIDRGVSILGAVLSSNLNQVILTTTPLKLAHTLSVNGVRDRSPNAGLIAANSSIGITLPSQFARLIGYAPEAQNYELVYQLAIPANSPGWNATGTTYDLDYRNAVGSFSRIAYCLELASGGATNWVYVSMDAFTTNANQIGIPDRASGAVFQQKVTNLNVFANVAGIVTGNDITTGNLEFWPWNYTGNNSLSIPNANSGTFDFGDQISVQDAPFQGDGGHGSMQVHNHGASQTLFGYNAWGTARTSELGIGNAPSGNPDWTSAGNAASYTVRNLFVLVLPADDTNGPVLAHAYGQSLTTVLVSFKEPVGDSAANPGCYAISGGVSVSSGQLQANRRQVLLTVSALTPGLTYTLTVNGVRDRSARANLIAPNSATTFSLAPVFSRVTEAAGYTLVHYLALPGTTPAYNANGLNYSLDLRPYLMKPGYDRIAYYLELAATVGGTTNWVYVSAEAFAPNINRVGVPVLGTGALFQRKLTNMNVLSGVSGVVTGTGITTGNLEFWPWNYDTATNVNSGATNGSGSTYDWNDSYNTGGQYGSMQLHNYGAGATGQVLFAFNNWGNATGGQVCLGIGNQSSGHPDWTLNQNGNSYAVRNLYVLVRITNSPQPAIAAAGLPPAIVQQPLPAAQLHQAGETVTLVTVATGTALTYQWRWNGTPLVDQTNSFLLLGNVQTNQNGSYDVIITNGLGSVTSLAASLTVNQPPVAGNLALEAWQDTPIQLNIGKLLATSADPDGDPLTISSAGPASLAAGSAGLAANTIAYTPPAGYVGPDSFTYHITDGRGGWATGQISVTVKAANAISLNLVSPPAILTNGHFRVGFAGIPNYTYSVQFSTNATGPWFGFTNLTAGTNGLFELEDATEPPPPIRFYRTTHP